MHELENVPDEKRTARFVCALALCESISNSALEWTARECCEGRIAHALTGSNGFGYDPLFFFPALNKTFGEIERAIKATVSHRGKALARLAKALPCLIDLHAKP